MARFETTARDARAVATNGIVLVGVALFGWSVSVLLVVYWVEAGVAIVRGAIQGLFAERVPEDLQVDSKLPASSWAEKRGGVSLWLLPPVYPRNVPLVLASLVVLALFWPIAGAVVAASVESGVSPGPAVIAIAALLVGHGVGLVDYFANGRYATASVRSALLRREVASVFVLGVGGLIAFAYASPPSVLLVVVVSIKLVGDVVFPRLGAPDPLAEFDDDSIEDRVPDGDPTDTFGVQRASLLLRAAGYVPLYLLVPPYLLVVLAAVFAGLIGGRGVGVAAGGLAVGVTAIGRLTTTAVRTAHLEYRVYPSRIVAYDATLEAPQWTLNRSTVTAVTIEASRLDRIRPGSRTVAVSTYDGTHHLRGLRRPEAFVESV